MFIDESGDLGMKGSKYLVLACLVTKDPKSLKRIIKNARRHKFKKELRKTNEIKANKSSKPLIKYLLNKLSELEGIYVFYVLLEKKKVYSSFLLDNKHKLYNYVAGKLAKYIQLDYNKAIIRIDKSKGKQILREDFNNYFSNRLKENCSIKNIKIHHSYSHSWEGLQFADLLAWALFQKFEHNNEKYINLVKIDDQDIIMVF